MGLDDDSLWGFVDWVWVGSLGKWGECGLRNAECGFRDGYWRGQESWVELAGCWGDVDGAGGGYTEAAKQLKSKLVQPI